MICPPVMFLEGIIRNIWLLVLKPFCFCICCSVTNRSKTQWLRTVIIFLLRNLRWCWIRVSPDAAAEVLAGSASSESLPGMDSLLQDGTSHGCWQEASVPHRVGLSTGPPKNIHDMTAGFSQSQLPKREGIRDRDTEREREKQGRNYSAFQDLVLELHSITSAFFYL